jgi:hypothetical protein
MKNKRFMTIYQRIELWAEAKEEEHTGAEAVKEEVSTEARG